MPGNQSVARLDNPYSDPLRSGPPSRTGVTAMFKITDFKSIAADLVAALAILAAGYSVPSFDNPIQCVPHMTVASEFLACLDQ